VLGKLLIEHVELALGFHGEAVDGVLDFYRCVAIKVAETAAEEGRRALQPEEPVQGFGAASRIFWQEVTEFFCQVEQN